MDTKWICQRLRALGLTQRCIAARMGVTAACLNHKLHNRRPMNLREAACLANWLGMDDAEIRKHFFMG